MLEKEVFEGLLGKIERLKEDSTLILVEGYKDKKSLLSLGFSQDRILPLQRKALFKVVEEVIKKDRRVAILTDLDKTGKRLYSKLKRDLSERGIYVDDALRNFLFRHTKLRQLEGLGNYIERNS
jgi:5S rRNA maturation endonuclease (ribonuclease M5)